VKAPAPDTKKEDLSRICPMPTCEELVPQTPDKFLQNLLKKYHERAELTKQGKKMDGRVHLVGQICSAISDYWKEGQDVSLTGSENGWPLDIDFEILPKRILKIQKKIELVLTNEFILDKIASWKTFTSLIKAEKYSLADFRRVDNWGKFRLVGGNAHAG
jgi:hypothetical protein